MEKPVTTDLSFVVVANRLPVGRIDDDGQETSWRTSPGGLVTAFEPLMRRNGGAWIGWVGAPDRTIEPFEHEGYTVIPVELSKSDVEDYYQGFSNDTLWPLYHDSIVPPTFNVDWWEAYRRVNRRFAERVAESAAHDATVWVQDYQLQLVPAFLRELRPDLKIGFFLHIPFPPVDQFEQLESDEELVIGLLGADLIGFQTADDAQNFLRLVTDRTANEVEGNQVRLSDGRISSVREYPISIDVTEFSELAESDEVKDEAARILEELGNPRHLLLGVDRLDYTKGLRHRVQAVGELFKEGQLDPVDIVFVQVATPSREDIEQYQILRQEIDELVTKTNAQVASQGRQAIVYRVSTLPRSTIAALYRLASVMLVTPLRDGMNLVAKEYVACHQEEGALVLSRFAGAAQELDDAYLVDPYDIEGTKAVIVKALNDERSERARRWSSLRNQVRDNTIHDWATEFLRDLESAN